jgi:hypothetical protein
MRRLVGPMAMVVAFMAWSVGASAATWPHIGSPEAVVDHAWRLDPNQGGCMRGQCAFSYSDLSIDVGFVNNAVTYFDLYDSTDAGNPKYWQLLTSLLPAHVRRVSCKTIQQTAFDAGPAKACIYRWGSRQILVAQYLTRNQMQACGTVDLNEGFAYIQAARQAPLRVR